MAIYVKICTSITFRIPSRLHPMHTSQVLFCYYKDFTFSCKIKFFFLKLYLTLTSSWRSNFIYQYPGVVQYNINKLWQIFFTVCSLWKNQNLKIILLKLYNKPLKRVRVYNPKNVKLKCYIYSFWFLVHPFQQQSFISYWTSYYFCIRYIQCNI